MTRRPYRDTKLPTGVRALGRLRNVPLPGDWAERAACRGMDTARFFPSREEPIEPELRALCRACPVLRDCRAYSLRWPVHGFWAGLSEQARERQRQKNRKAS